jgi:general secretion pathway protein F/type IV pilus assembly protein PilC
MPDYSYEALNKTGQRNTGTLTAATEREAAAMLDARGLFPLKVLPQRSAAEGRRFAGFGGGVGRRHIAVMFSQLADLLHSGVPMLKAIEVLERQSTNKRLCAILRDVRMKVADGTGLAQAMSMHPKAFDELAVSMVRAGQEGGFLEDVLKRIAVFVEHQEDLKSKVVGAMAYPAFLAVAMFLVINVLIIFFVPKFEPVFEKLKAKDELPWITEKLIAVSHFQQSWLGLVTGLLCAAGFVGFVMWTRRGGRLWADRMRLRLPLAGKVFLALSLSRFTRILGTMLHNGIPILKALSISKDSTGNRVLSAAIEQSAENVTAGEKLADPFRKCKYFPTDVVEMIAVGEESNNLEKVLIDIAESLEKRTSRQLDLMVKLLEPMMLLIMACAVLAVVAGLLLPVFKMGEVVE